MPPLHPGQDWMALSKGGRLCSTPGHGLLQGARVTLYPCVLHSGVLSSIGKIFKEEGLLGFFVYVSLYTP